MCIRPIRIGNILAPCHKCIQCRLQYSTSWAWRIAREAQQYDYNVMVTLTYNDENMPADRSVSVREMQLFLKRLRFKIQPLQVRYFLCGEYGSEKNTARPHYHVIIFGYVPEDIEYLGKSKRGHNMYRSSIIEHLWQKGFVSLEELNFRTARYVAKYLQKQQCADGRTAPFVKMSLKPAIGCVNLTPAEIETGYAYVDGQAVPFQRSQWNKAVKDGGLEVEAHRIALKNAYKINSGLYRPSIDCDGVLEYIPTREFWELAEERVSENIKKMENIFGAEIVKKYHYDAAKIARQAKFDTEMKNRLTNLDFLKYNEKK